MQYPEEKDSNLWKKYVNQEKSGYAAHHGDTQPPEQDSQVLQGARGIRDREGRDSDATSETQVPDGHNVASGVRVDAEKGKDLHVIDWYGENDPQVRYIQPKLASKHLDTHTI